MSDSPSVEAVALVRRLRPHHEAEMWHVRDQLAAKAIDRFAAEAVERSYRQPQLRMPYWANWFGAWRP